MVDNVPGKNAAPLDNPGPADDGVWEKQDTQELFEEDYSVYADRGPNCLDWSDRAV
jgi:hypothetical protein